MGHILEDTRIESVLDELAVPLRVDEIRVLEDSEVEGQRVRSDAERLGQHSRGGGPVPQGGEDGPAGRVGQGLECPVESKHGDQHFNDY